jgi:K+-transporting ATPase KdpF subunit
MTLETAIAVIVSVAMLLYLVYTLVRPERF